MIIMSTIANAVFSQNDPIYSLPHLYIAGCNISVASTTVLAIAPGQVRDSNDVIDMPISFPNLQGNTYPATLFQNYLQPLFINSAVNGINGLDAGSLAVSTQYAIYLIGDSRGNNQVAGLITLASNAFPLIPLGYDSYRLIGFIETDTASHFVYATHEPQTLQNSLSYYLQPAVSVLSAGDATTFTGVDLNSAVPTGALPNVIVYLLVTFIPAAIGDTLVMRPTGSTATTGLVTITGITAGVAQSQYIAVIAGVNGSTHASIDYEVTSASDSASLSVVGWTGAPHQAYPT
jgi:hypothetical protein